MDLSIIIATRNRPKALADMLHTLEKATRPGFEWEVLVVDNDSSPDLLPAVEEAVRNARLRIRLLSESGPGKSFAVNLGIREARGKVTAFLDDDVTVHEEYLTGIEKALRSFRHNVYGGRVLPILPWAPPVWVTGGKPLKTTRGPIVAHDYGDSPVPYDENMFRPIGANFFCRRNLFDRFGPFDVRLGRRVDDKSFVGGEESELLKRFQDGGETILYMPWTTVDHPVDPQRMTKSYFRRRMFVAGRSKPYFADIAKRTYPSIFGIPRYLYRQFLTSILKCLSSLVTGNTLKAFDHQLDAWNYYGGMYEYKRLHNRNR